MNFIFEWQELCLTSERSERVRHSSCHSNIKFISSRHRVISSIYSIIRKRLEKKRLVIVVRKTDRTVGVIYCTIVNPNRTVSFSKFSISSKFSITDVLAVSSRVVSRSLFGCPLITRVASSEELVTMSKNN